jgi:hypothetical protein
VQPGTYSQINGKTKALSQAVLRSVHLSASAYHALRLCMRQVDGKVFDWAIC